MKRVLDRIDAYHTRHYTIIKIFNMHIVMLVRYLCADHGRGFGIAARVENIAGEGSKRDVSLFGIDVPAPPCLTGFVKPV